MFRHGCIVIFVLGCSTLLAQQQPTRRQPARPAAPPAATAKPATEKPAAAKPAEEKPVDFDQQLTQWKGLLAELERVRAAWKIGMPEERKKLEQEFNDLLAKGDAMLPGMIKAAEAAFASDAPGKESAGEFLAAVANSAGQDSDYELTARLTKLLLEGDFEAKGLYDVAGRAAFVTSDYDSAEKYLKAAKEKGGITQQGEGDLGQIPTYREHWKKEEELRDAEAKANDLPRVELKTSKGTIVVELFENEAPNTVANFVSLVEKGYYNGTPFHRVLPDFMAQGGDPTGTGSGGPGYTIKDECREPNHRLHFRGSLSMAKTAAPDTGGSQFFLTFRPTSHLDGKHTVFGRIIEGIDVLPKIQRRDPNDSNAPKPDKIVEAKVLRKRNHEYKPETQPEKK